MNLKNFEKLTRAQFLHDAFDDESRKQLLHAALFRRNLYLTLFIIGIISIFISGFLGPMPLCILSLFLATLSLVIMTKYDTQLFFLKILEKKASHIEDSSSAPNPD